MQLLYFAGTGFIRLSIVAFLPRLSKERNIIRISWASVLQLLSCQPSAVSSCFSNANTFLTFGIKQRQVVSALVLNMRRTCSGCMVHSAFSSIPFRSFSLCGSSIPTWCSLRQPKECFSSSVWGSSSLLHALLDSVVHTVPHLRLQTEVWPRSSSNRNRRFCSQYDICPHQNFCLDRFGGERLNNWMLKKYFGILFSVNASFFWHGSRTRALTSRFT